ncbi:MAG: PAS domain S-box protein, partial [Candidatus Binatia bacterium]
MIGRLFAFLRSAEAGKEFRRETRELVLSRLRIGALLALTFIPVFAPLDFLRLHDHFLAATAIRLFGCALLGILVAITYLPSAERFAERLSGFGICAISATIMGVARFSDGADDPVYLVQAMAIIFVIMGAGLLLPVDGPTMLRLSLIPVAVQVVLTLDYDVFQNLPILSSSFIAAIIATVGARSTFRSRVGDYEGQQAKEELLQARSDLVGALSRDLSAREEAEEVLRRSEQKYRALFEDLKDAVILASPDGKVVDVNPAGLELFGFATKEELAAADAGDFYCQIGDRDTIRAMMTEHGFLKDHEVELRRRDGQTVKVMLTMTIVRDGAGAMSGVRTIFR